VDEDLSLQVGKRLKVWRDTRGLTMRELADASGLSLNTISLIERGKTSPTIHTLHKLAKALGIEVANFLTEDRQKNVIFLQREQRTPTRSGNLLLRSLGTLGTGLKNQAMEPLLITLEPHADSGPEPMMHPGQELVFCLEGQVIFEINGLQYPLRSGDSLFFEASLPHLWRNDQDVPSKVLLVIQSVGQTQIAPL